ncbi:MAG: hypothetical protein AAFN78_15920, partial [Pseudomonadota bacterium]
LTVSNSSRIQLNAGAGSVLAASATPTVNTGELELFGDFNNDSAITITDGVIDIGNLVGDEWSNTGSITLTNSTVELGGAFTAADIGTITGTGLSVINGALDNSGQVLDLGASLPTPIELRNGASILGGTLSTTPLSLFEFSSATLDGVTLAADFEVQRGSTLTVNNDLTLNSATVTLTSDNNFTNLTVSGANGDTSTIGGTGEILLSGTATVDNRNRILVSGAGHILDIAPGVTVRTDTTGGEIRHNNNGPMTLRGAIVSDVPNRTLTINSTTPVSIEGNLSVGAGSVIDLNNYALASSAELDVEVGGLATADFGRYMGDDGTLAGTLDIALVNGFSPGLGDTVEIMSFNVSRTGTFDTENGTGIGGGLSFQVNYNASDVTLEVIN